MATLTLTPVLKEIRKNDDGTFVFICAMNDPQGINRGFRELRVAADGTVTDMNGNPTGTNLTSAQMTTLNNNWNNYQAGINTIDTANKFPF